MKEKLRFLGFGCPCRDDRCSGCGGGWRGKELGNHSELCRADPQDDQEAWSSREVESLL
jgi:hypothetical protein